MKILFLTQYFPPETGAAQNRLSDLACRLAASGNNVTVLTALPSYPKGRIFDGYRGRLWMIERQKGIRIVRTWVFATKRKGFAPRILNYLSFCTLACFAGLLRVRSLDVVFVESPPLFAGVCGYVLSKLKGAKFVLNISDLWPESAVVLGMLRNENLIRWATRVEEGLYRRAALVTGQTQGIVNSIRVRCPGVPVVLLTNGVAPEFFAQVEEARFSRDRTREEFRFGLKLIVAYTGIHGLAQGLDTVLRAAKMLSDYGDIQFVFWGDGPEKPHLQSMAATDELKNVRFLPPVPASRMADILAAVDVSIVPLKRDDLFKGALPSKLFEAIGAGVPVIAAMDGEARKIVEESGGGLVVEPEDPTELAEAILQLHKVPVLRERLAENGRKYIQSYYNRKNISESIETLLLEIMSPTGPMAKGRFPALTEEESHRRSLELVTPRLPKTND